MSLTNPLAGLTITTKPFVLESQRQGKSQESLRTRSPGVSECTSSEYGNLILSMRRTIRKADLLDRDTVSSVGIIRGDVFLSTSSSAAHACHFRHALALDELRVKFMPEYFHEMNTQSDDGESKYIDTRLNVRLPKRASAVSDNGSHRSEGNKAPKIKEVWFAGSHSDVWVLLQNPHSQY